MTIVLESATSAPIHLILCVADRLFRAATVRERNRPDPQFQPKWCTSVSAPRRPRWKEATWPQ